MDPEQTDLHDVLAETHRQIRKSQEVLDRLRKSAPHDAEFIRKVKKDLAEMREVSQADPQ